jgi:hypothetical protein
MSDEPRIDENATWDLCGRFGAYEFDGQRRRDTSREVIPVPDLRRIRRGVDESRHLAR